MGHRARTSSGRVPEVPPKIPRVLRAAELARLHAVAALQRCGCRRDACVSAGNQRPERMAQMLTQEDRENQSGKYEQPAAIQSALTDDDVYKIAPETEALIPRRNIRL